MSLSQSSVNPLRLFALALGLTLPSLSLAQPAQFADLGAIAPPQSAWTYQQVPIPPGAIRNGAPGEAPEALGVKWFRFEISSPIAGTSYLDIDTQARGHGPAAPGDLFLAMFDAQGNLIASDDEDGSSPRGYAPGLSFGSGQERPRLFAEVLRGQDGAELTAGVYWIALAAGPADRVSLGSSGWTISTSARLPLGLYAWGTYEVAIRPVVGNTAAPPTPSNNVCAIALPISEGDPAWSGTNLGAAPDAGFPCRGPLRALWFSYTPSATGYAEVEASDDGGESSWPVLARLAAGCGGPLGQCDEGDMGAEPSFARLGFAVVQGRPVLLGLAVNQGQTSSLSLRVTLRPPPCQIEPPAGAVEESEAVCGSNLNGGCGVQPPAFDALVLGRAVTGRVSGVPSSPDSDSFEFSLAERSVVTLRFAAQSPITARIATFGSSSFCWGEPRLIETARNLDLACFPRQRSLELPAGRYRLTIDPAYFDGYACSSPDFSRYWVRVDATTGCAGDFNADGERDGDDVVAYFQAWDLLDAAADLTLDGRIDGSDARRFFERWDSGC